MCLKCTYLCGFTQFFVMCISRSKPILVFQEEVCNTRLQLTAVTAKGTFDLRRISMERTSVETPTKAMEMELEGKQSTELLNLLDFTEGSDILGEVQKCQSNENLKCLPPVNLMDGKPYGGSTIDSSPSREAYPNRERTEKPTDERVPGKQPQQKCAGDSSVKCMPTDRFMDGPRDSRTSNPETIRRALENIGERNAKPTEAERSLANNIEKSLQTGNLKELDQMLETLAAGPAGSADRVVKALQERLSKQHVDGKIIFAQDQNGHRIANLELSKRNDWTKSSGSTMFSYNSNGEMRATHKPSGDIFAPAVAVNPIRALTTIMYSKL